MMQPGDEIDLDITGVAHGGVFVARHEGRVVFVPDTLPGERVRVRLTQTGDKSFWRAEAVQVRDASPHRQAHVWRQADIDIAPEIRPGGADFGHIDLAHQRELKLQVLHDALQRIGGQDLPAQMRVPDGESSDGTRWRTRVSLHVDEEGLIGPYAARSHRVIEVDDLPLATAAVERVATRVHGVTGRIDLVQPADGHVRIVPRPAHARRPPRGGRGRGAGAGRRGRGVRDEAAQRAAKASASRAAAAVQAAREVVTERVGDRKFLVDAGGFWQVHRKAALTLHDAVTQAVREATAAGGLDPDATHLDLYGGVGLFAAALGELGGPGTRMISVESDARATEHAGQNLAEWVGARAETARVDRWLAQLRETASERERERIRRGVVVLDPPRAGAGGEVVTGLAALAPEAIVYVACDPVALARDLKTLREAGYEASAVTAIDLFPNSHHLEAVVPLVRQEAVAHRAVL